LRGPDVKLSSPRRRRRLAWLAGILGAVGVIALVVVLVPNRGGPEPRGVPRPPSFDGGQRNGAPLFGSSAAEDRAARRAETEVRPLAERFVADVLQRRTRDAARLASPKLRIPSLRLDATSSGGASVAFSGATTVGFVSSFSPDVLLAFRFDRTNGRWLATYVHTGHSSSHVSAADYSPSGFAPGSTRETTWTWLALAGGLVLVIAVGVVVERLLRPRTA